MRREKVKLTCRSFSRYRIFKRSYPVGHAPSMWILSLGSSSDVKSKVPCLMSAACFYFWKFHLFLRLSLTPWHACSGFYSFISSVVHQFTVLEIPWACLLIPPNFSSWLFPLCYSVEVSDSTSSQFECNDWHSMLSRFVNIIIGKIMINS